MYFYLRFFHQSKAGALGQVTCWPHVPGWGAAASQGPLGRAVSQACFRRPRTQAPAPAECKAVSCTKWKGLLLSFHCNYCVETLNSKLDHFWCFWLTVSSAGIPADYLERAQAQSS